MLILPAMAAANNAKAGDHGYYFIDVKVENPQDEFGLYAVPCEYGKTGVSTFYVSTDGTVWKKDLGGQLPDPAKPPDVRDGTWVVQ